MKFHGKKHMCFRIKHFRMYNIYYVTIYEVWFTEQILNLMVFFLWRLSRMQYQQ